MDEWEQVREIWLLHQRGERPSDVATRKEHNYYRLIEQIEAANHKSEQIATPQSSGCYHFRLQTKERFSAN